MRVLLVTSNWTETLGHAVRSIAVAQSLVRRRHEVAYLGFPSYREWLPSEVKFYPCEPLPGHQTRDIYFGNHTYEDVVYVSGHTRDDHIIRTVERERAVIRCFQPDIIFNDEQFTLGLSAKLEQVPVISLVTWPLHPLFNREMEDKMPERRSILLRSRNCWNRVLRKYELEPIGHLGELLFERSDSLITPTSSLLEPELKNIATQVHYVGPLEPSGKFDIEPEWLQKEEDRPLIFIYLSSLKFPGGINSSETFNKLYESFVGQSYRVVFALGKYNTESHGLPDRSHDGGIRFEAFVPGSAVMKRSSLAIYPATHNMMLSALRHQVPSLLLPDMFERMYNAECLARTGLGQHLELAMSPDQIRDFCKTFSLNVRSLQPARALQADLRELGGPDRVVKLMEANLKASEEIV
jgi:UDP:flavonoid glycosyltransferase YjiC (YdhE family)